MIKAVIFDFDGVIVNSETQKFKDLNKALSKLEYKEIADFRSFIGKKTANILKENFPGMSEEKITEFVNQRRTMLRIQKSPLIPGAKEILEQLSSRFALALATGTEKEIVENHLKEYGLAEHFDIIVSGEDFSYSKPDPESYKITLQRLGVEGNNTIVIEDSQAGVEAATKAGCTVYGLDTYNIGLKADKVFRSYSELREEFK